MPKDKKEKEKKEKDVLLNVGPNVLYSGQSRFAYKTELGLFVISFKLKNIIPNTLTYIVRIFLYISKNETQFIKEFSFDSFLEDKKIFVLIRQISNNKFRRVPYNYEEFNTNVAKEILQIISTQKSSQNAAILGKNKVPTNVTLVSASPTASPVSGLTISNYENSYLNYITTSNNTAALIGYYSTGGMFPWAVIVSDTIEDSFGNLYTVTAIGTSTSIGCFNNCGNLSSITIPYTVTSIYNGNINVSAFNYCQELKTVTFTNGPNGEPPQLTHLGDYTFNNCSFSLKTINIPNSVTYLGQFTFALCSSLTSIILPKNSNFNTINSGTFTDCSLLKTITIYNNVTSIMSGSAPAFGGCTSLKSQSNYGTLNTNSISGEYVYDYFLPPGKNGFYVNYNYIA